MNPAGWGLLYVVIAAFILFRFCHGLSPQELLNAPYDLESILEGYRPARENGLRVLPETENATVIAPGLPGTNFQPVPQQNIADLCFPISQCNSSQRYRTINGSCNNLRFPMWGLTGTALVRLIPAHYQDGLHEPSLARSGRPLPNPRQLRNIVLPNRAVPDHINTRIVMAWGQIISHETTHISVLPVGNLGGLECCANNHYPNVGALPPQCWPIQVATDDPYFGHFNQTCFNFVRAITTTDYGCSLVPQQQLAMVTHFVDASWVYGSTDLVANELRAKQGGRLIVTRTPDGRMFPPNIMNATHYCGVTSNNDTCYFGGRNYSSRNRILDYDFTQLYNGYEPLLNPTSINEFTAAAYRAFHCLIPSTMDLTKESRCPYQSLQLSDWFFRPTIIPEPPGNFDGLIRGLATQRSNQFTNDFSPQVTDKLFRLEAPYGSDLAAIDIQRSRDHGIPPYNEFRVACGLPRAKNFSDFRDYISEDDIKLLSQHYEDVNDVEAYVAGLMERPAGDALTGPTFQCIIGEQFVRWRNGDRFYYQFANQSGSFTPAQYRELEKIRLSLIFCRNSDHIQNIQANVFNRPSTTNRLAPCSELPQINLEPWRET